MIKNLVEVTHTTPNWSNQKLRLSTQLFFDNGMHRGKKKVVSISIDTSIISEELGRPYETVVLDNNGNKLDSGKCKSDNLTDYHFSMVDKYKRMAINQLDIK